VDILPKEYPSAVFLSASLIFVADGLGAIYAFHISEEGQFALAALFHSSTGPCRLHSAHNVSDLEAIAVLSSRNKETHEVLPDVRGRSISFDVWAAKFELPMQSSGAPTDLNIIWSRRGNSVPLYTSYDPTRQAVLIFGGSVYENLEVPPLPTYEPTGDEIAPIPRAGEDLENPAIPPPYSWTQTEDSVTVAFPLPAVTKKSNIHVAITSKTFSLSISGVESQNIVLPSYAEKRLLEPIHTSSSYWTWDREGSHTFGLLTIYFDKAQTGYKWMHVFESSGMSVDGGGDVEVPETLDPSELALIRDNMEKFTAAIQSGEDSSGLGLGRGVPSLAENEMDEELDSNVGRFAVITMVGLNEQVGPYSHPIQLLATPLPGVNEAGPSTFIMKHDVDGTVFSLEPSTLSSQPEWTHISTYNALAFVLASKRDTRFIHHIPGKAVYAFESGARSRGANIYVYRSDSPQSIWAKQAILRVGDGSGGALLGVGGIEIGGKQKILCLLENELAIMDALQ
jgi:hypothetical protein